MKGKEKEANIHLFSVRGIMQCSTSCYVQIITLKSSYNPMKQVLVSLFCIYDTERFSNLPYHFWKLKLLVFTQYNYTELSKYLFLFPLIRQNILNTRIYICIDIYLHSALVQIDLMCI